MGICFSIHLHAARRYLGDWFGRAFTLTMEVSRIEMHRDACVLQYQPRSITFSLQPTINDNNLQLLSAYSVPCST